MSRHALSIVFAVLLFGAVLFSRGAQAHGGGTPQLTNENIGPYWISVWTSPEPVREGELHLTVAVAEPGETAGGQAGAPVLGADVDITLVPRSGGLADVRAPATNEQAANKLFYEADLLVPAAGDWLVQIDVEGPQGNGTAEFGLDVLPAQDNRWLVAGGAGFLILAAFFVFYSVRRRR